MQEKLWIVMLLGLSTKNWSQENAEGGSSRAHVHFPLRGKLGLSCKADVNCRRNTAGMIHWWCVCKRWRAWNKEACRALKMNNLMQALYHIDRIYTSNVAWMLMRGKKRKAVFPSGLTRVTWCRRQHRHVGVRHTACSLCVHTKQCHDVGVSAGKWWIPAGWWNGSRGGRAWE